MKKIKLILGTSRQGRVSPKIAESLQSTAKKAGHDVEVVDIKDLNLGFYDSPTAAMYSPVDNPEARNWASIVDNADGLIFLTAEYNASFSAVLKNAIDMLYKEWNSKPTAIVGYGYGGGVKATAHLRDVLNHVKTSIVGPDTSIMFTRDTFNSATRQFIDLENTMSESNESFINSLKLIEAA